MAWSRDRHRAQQLPQKPCADLKPFFKEFDIFLPLLLRRSLWLVGWGVGLGVMASLAAQAQTPVRVGSKIDTEGKLLGHLIVLALEAKGIKTENKIALGNTKIVRAALLAGEIDIYPEYTGNGAFSS